MIRALLLSLLAAAVSACGGSQSATPAAALRQPSGIALFRGVTIDAPSPKRIRPYLAIASESRSEISLVDATDGTPVLAPIGLRTLVVPVPGRPALLASASLGDGMADLLVVVAAGDTRVQLVHTWTAANDVEDTQAADLGLDVLALAAVPSAPGTARIAAALADGGLALIEYTRQARGIVLSSVVVNPLPFQAVSLAAVPQDRSHVYAATLDELAPGVFGVAEVDVSNPAAWTVRPLDARGPTRLVAAALLHERKADAAADDASAFDLLAAPTPRVYAVLDESGCGFGRRIDCGIAMIDPAPTVGRIPDDWAGWMPYRAPLRLGSRPVALAIAAPPEKPPSAGDAIYQGTLMRLYRGTSALATTGVGAVATEDGNVHFLDLGRFKVATQDSPLASRGVSVDSQPAVGGQRLWLLKEDGSLAASLVEAAAAIGVTPGYTIDDAWVVTYQGVLPGLQARSAEVGLLGPGQPWLALQRGYGAPGSARLVAEVARLWDPALAVEPGDIVMIDARGVAGCEDPQDLDKTFEAAVGVLLAPTAEYPGGAVTLLERPGSSACFAALEAAVGAGGGLATKLTASVRSGGLLLTSQKLGQAGRPLLGVKYTLEYPGTAGGEDALACPLDGWDGSLPAPPCTGACRDDCRRLVLARKARRIHHLAEGCGADPDCSARWPGLVFPGVNGPALELRVGVESGTLPPPEARPGDTLRFSTRSGAAGLRARPTTGSPVHPNGIVAFDRSPFEAAAGYRFLVSYPADFVLDATPSVNPVEIEIVR